MTKTPVPAAGIIVMAKEPVPGRVKTRLCPPLTPKEAAVLAEAALADTLEAVAATPAAWRAVSLAGRSGPWLPGGFTVRPQRGDGFDERLAAAFADSGAPALVIGADSPQVTPELLSHALDQLLRPGVGSVIGPAPDGGYWALGLRAADARVFLGVPMSRSDTFSRQLARLEELSLVVSLLPALRDVDTFDDAVAVAAEAPRSRFATALGRHAAPAGSPP